MTKVELKTVSQLLDMKFTIPLYQRGYRWEIQQVKDLLEDINGFMRCHRLDQDTSVLSPAEKSEIAHGDDFYCIQPLAVKEIVKDSKGFIDALPKTKDEDILSKTRKAIKENVCWEVIDGQQRLTTIFIVLQYLNHSKSFDIEFVRWRGDKNLKNVVQTITKETAIRAIDLWHIYITYEVTRDFFDGDSGKSNQRDCVDYKARFLNTLLNKVQFIWYESDDEDPVKVFTRLNIGKIALTNSELIKALFLNRSNFTWADTEKIRLRQLEISARWDEIEATLQEEEFWMFIHDFGFDKPTRIDFIFDLMCEMELLGKPQSDIGNDQYRTFRYFNEYVRKDTIETCWRKIDGIFAAFKEWFTDLTSYHYVGYLIACRMGVKEILKEWRRAQSKNDFISALKTKIRNMICGCNNLDELYENGNKDKKQCRPLLLLHNIQTVINQNRRDDEDGQSKNAFYKFPFHLFKSEGWDVEHIDSNSENELVNKQSQDEFLLNRYLAVPENLQEMIAAFISNASPEQGVFEKLKDETTKVLGGEHEQDKLSSQDEKNKIWNFALLDSSTNRGYGNAIFSAKRRIIIGKDRGRPLPIPRIAKNDGKSVLKFVNESDARAESVFIPPCTRQAFFKYYSPVLSTPNYWTRMDAEYYRDDIFKTLKEFGVVNGTKKAE